MFADLARSASDIREALRPADASGDRGVDFARCFFHSCIPDYGQAVAPWIVAAAERYAADAALTAGERHVLHRLRCAAIERPPFGDLGDAADRLTRLIDGDATLLLVPGEHWAEQAHLDLPGMPDAARGRWAELRKHALTATAVKPAASWRKAAQALASGCGTEDVVARRATWFALFGRGSGNAGGSPPARAIASGVLTWALRNWGSAAAASVRLRGTGTGTPARAARERRRRGRRV